ncbi:MAG: 7-cyano-7-deazaguanine reductase [Flavobacteriales bacterium]|jgi:7-cyano-7-deazaguanine reductase
MASILLGEDSLYPDQYDASLLGGIPRNPSAHKMLGMDVWNAYELSWLAANGLPQVAIAEFSFDAANPNIVESKSFKYYLNSLNQSYFESVEALSRCLKADLSAVAGGVVLVDIYDVADEALGFEPIPGHCIDTEAYERNSRDGVADVSLLKKDGGQPQVHEQLYSHLFKSNCPVTGQPDWATVWIEYEGEKIDRASLLAYIVSYRKHQGFHESCVEGIYCDLMSRFELKSLAVYARYTRRGGLDINPLRASENLAQAIRLPFGRTLRQ